MFTLQTSFNPLYLGVALLVKSLRLFGKFNFLFWSHTIYSIGNTLEKDAEQGVLTVYWIFCTTALLPPPPPPNIKNMIYIVKEKTTVNIFAMYRRLRVHFTFLTKSSFVEREKGKCERKGGEGRKYQWEVMTGSWGKFKRFKWPHGPRGREIYGTILDIWALLL